MVNCDWCQRIGSISHRNEMAQQPIIEFKPFDVWEIDFIGSFSQSGSDIYILLVVDYVWS